MPTAERSVDAVLCRSAAWRLNRARRQFALQRVHVGGLVASARVGGPRHAGQTVVLLLGLGLAGR